MPRSSNRGRSEKDDGRNCEQETKRRVFIMPNNILNDNETNSSLVKLRHPKTGIASLYLFNDDDSIICEVLKYEEKPGSWFMGNYVQSDGSLYICTEMNALFLVLRYLRKIDKFVVLDQILVDDEFPECRRLISCKNLENIHRISDSKKYDGQILIKYNKNKTLEWLRNKVEKVVVNLKDNKISVAKGSQLSTFIRSKKDDPINHEDYLRFACGILSEYLESELSQELTKYLNLECKRDVIHGIEDEPPAKRAKLGKSVEPTENYSSGDQLKPKVTKETKKLSHAHKALEKVDKTGMKNISSFFTKCKK